MRSYDVVKSIELRGLRKRYRNGVVALDGLDLSVPGSCIFGLLGPNGAGKSTALNIIAGIVRKDAGSVFLWGNQIGDNDYAYKREVGFVLEKPHYIEKLTVKEYLEFAAVMYGIDPVEACDRVDELITFFELDDKKNEWIETYSAGMKKKVALAAALIHRPKLLLLDEPLESIDPLSASIIKDNLRLMADRGMTVLLTSHTLDTAEKLCDEVAIIHEGKRVLQTRMADLHDALGDSLDEKTPGTLEKAFLDVILEENDATSRRRNRLSWL